MLDVEQEDVVGVEEVVYVVVGMGLGVAQQEVLGIEQ